MRIAILAAALAPAACGCVARLGDLTVISTKNVGLDIDLTQAKSKGEVEGTSGVPIILSIPIGQPNIEDAIDDALSKGQGQVLTDVKVHVSTIYLILFGSIEYRVKGTVWEIPGLPLPEPPEEPSTKRNESTRRPTFYDFP